MKLINVILKIDQTTERKNFFLSENAIQITKQNVFYDKSAAKIKLWPRIKSRNLTIQAFKFPNNSGIFNISDRGKEN